MANRRVLRLSILSIAILISGTSLAQQRPPEYLNIDNQGDTPITVLIRANGDGSPSRKWQSFKIEKATKGAVRLRGFEPFDIAIRQNNGRDIVFSGVNLCTIMRKCAATGQREWPLPVRTGQWITNPNGTQTFVWEVGIGNSVISTADEDEVTIPFSPIGFPLPSAPPPIPRGGPSSPLILRLLAIDSGRGKGTL